MPVLDPDAIARETNPQNPSQVAISAGREVLESWRRFIAERVSFAIETTLAGVGPLVRIREARDAGYLIHVHYVAIDTRELNIERVRRRVRQGGHGIPERDIRRRYERSLANASQVLALAERATLLDNSSHQTNTIAEIESGKVSWAARSLPAWASGILDDLNRA